MKSRRIKAVFFDMNGTLVHFPPDFTPARFLQRVYRELGLEVDLERIERAYEAAEAWWAELFADDFTRWTRESFVEFNLRMLSFLGLPGREDELVGLAGRVQDRWERLPEEAGELIYPEVPAALEGLERWGLILGIVSHRTLAATRCSLQRHRILEHFRVLVSPQVAQAPRGKLELAMWEYALEQAGVGPEEAVHLGDHYEHDVLGPRAAGLLPILIDREERHTGADCLRAKDLLEAARLLRDHIITP